MNVAEKLFNEVREWTLQTFGPNRDPLGILEHMEEELDELRTEVEKQIKKWNKSNAEMLSEYADVQILLWNLMSRFGLCHNRLMDAITIKMIQNKKREWGPVIGSKKIKHKTPPRPTHIKITDVDGKISLHFQGDVVFHFEKPLLAKLQERIGEANMDIVAYSDEFNENVQG